MHPGKAILPLKLLRFTEFAASRLRKSLAADLAQALCAKDQRGKEEVATSLAGDHSCMTNITQTLSLIHI